MTRFVARSLLLASLSPFALVQPALAQENQGAVPPPPAQEAGEPEPNDQSTIIVTGTRRRDRTVADSTVPVDVLSAEDLTQTGFTEINRALNQEVPSFNFPQPAITDGTDVIRPATLRGLWPDHTLVLINGKRRHTSSLLNINGSVGRGAAAVDLNLIPTIALSRVEILRDGAAAQYGSDAIGGVINFHLRNAREGGRATATYGQYYTRVEGIETYDGVQVGPGNTPVFAPDSTSGTPILALNYTGEDRKRRDGHTLTLAGVIGLPVLAEGSFNVAAEFQDREDTNRTGADPRQQFNLIGGALDPRELSFNRFSHRYGDPKTRDTKVFANFEMPVGTAGTEIYSFGTYNDRQGESAGFYRLARDARNVPAIYPEGFLPLIVTDTDDYAATFGVRGNMAGWRWDASGQYGRDVVDFTIENSLNRSFGAASQTEFDSGGLRYGQTLFNLDLSRDLALGFGERTTLSVGAEYRREAFDIRPGEPASYENGPAGGAPGAQVFPGFRPTIAGQRVDQEKRRNSKSLYAEVDSDISRMFNVQLAARFEDYSDFGSDLNWKIASRFEPAEGYAVRGSVSTGFRAPSLQQQFYGAQATNNVGGVLLDTVTLPVDNPAAQALGSSPLQPEQSMNYSAGLVITAVPRLNITVDAYQVDIDDRIVVTENLGAFGTTAQQTAVRNILIAAGFPNVTAARFFINGIDTRTRGLDFVATYRPPLDFAEISLTGGLNLNKTKITRNAAAPGPLANIPGLVLFGRRESLRMTEGQPRSKLNFSADVERGPVGGTIRLNRYGKVLAADNDPFNDVEMSAKTITDVELRVQPFGDRATLAIGSNNLFDVYPDNIPRGRMIDPATGLPRNQGATNYVTPFSAYSPFGFNGRFLYARVAVNF